MHDSSSEVILRDSTLREGLDTPGVVFSAQQRRAIARLLEEANVSEIELVAPSRVLEDLSIARALKEDGATIATSGLVYAYSPRCTEEIQQAGAWLDWVTLLMPVSEKRKPYGRDEKRSMLARALDHAGSARAAIGVGFPHATQTDAGFLLQIGTEAVERGVRRITLYDTNGSGDPFSIRRLLEEVAAAWKVDVFFHGHNDLGLATANSLAAVRGGARGVDVTTNGLGDRAGNASLEQVVMALRLQGFRTHVRLERLDPLCHAVERMSGVPISKLAPVVGDYVFVHRSPSHLSAPGLFEAFDPSLLQRVRRLVE
jgi:homocitrate synthase NifV